MPAIVLVTSLAAEGRASEPCRVLAQRAAAPLRAEKRAWWPHLDTVDTFVATVARRSGAAEPIQTWSDDSLTIVLEGYLARQPADRKQVPDAELIADLYRRGPAAVEGLDGSFVIVAIDRRAATVVVWTDRTATRPSFWARPDGVLVVAPELKCFAHLPGLRRELAPGSLAAMTMNGALMDEHTYYRDVQLLGPARRLTVRPGALTVARYWQRTFGGEPAGRPPPAREVSDCLCRAVQRHLAPFRRPILALSGGLDSRIILAACRCAGLNVPAVTWGFDNTDTPGSDVDVACRLAARLGTEHRVLRLDVDALPQHAERVVYWTDGLTGHLGNYTEGDRVARELASDFDALVRGDEMFGDYPPVWARRLALAQVGINVGKRLWLLRFLLKRDRAGAVLRDYRTQRRMLLDSVPASAPPADVTDIVFPRTRLPRVIASQSPVFRGHMEVVCPLLDGEVVELLRYCTPAQREDKRFISECVRTEFPEELALPLNTVHSRTSWRQRLPRPGRAQRFLVETLLDPLASFDEWFDRSAIRAWLGYATAEGAQAAWPADTSAPRRQAARLAAYLLRPTFKERVLLNLVTLKLWFKLFGKATS